MNTIVTLLIISILHCLFWFCAGLWNGYVESKAREDSYLYGSGFIKKGKIFDKYIHPKNVYKAP